MILYPTFDYLFHEDIIIHIKVFNASLQSNKPKFCIRLCDVTSYQLHTVEACHFTRVPCSQLQPEVQARQYSHPLNSCRCLGRNGIALELRDLFHGKLYMGLAVFEELHDIYRRKLCQVITQMSGRKPTQSK